MEKGLMLVVSGPAGSGKGTVNGLLIKTGDYTLSVSATTRAPRVGEVDGVNYHYITKEEFLNKISSGEMLEYTEYCGNYYGTIKKEAEAILETGKNLILEIEVEGAKNIKTKYPDAVLVLLLPPSYSIQEKRLRARGTETEDKILLRLKRAKEEVELAGLYDYVVYNHDGGAADAAAKIAAIVEAEKSSIKRNPDIIKNFFAE